VLSHGRELRRRPVDHVVIVIIRNQAGDYFVHRRLSTKRLFPSLYGLGAGGKVDPGESALGAARRELEEETGLSLKPTKLFEMVFDSPEVSHQISVYELSTRAAPAHDGSEWQWSGWLSEAEVLKLSSAGQLCPDTAAVLQRFQALRTSR
jgi:8-oxo-dGTP pyrophosphatase MutT (NUDIX family)